MARFGLELAFSDAAATKGTAAVGGKAISRFDPANPRAQMWARIGVRVRVEALPSSAYFSRSARDAFSIGLLGWGTGTGEPDSPLANLLATIDPTRGRGSSNRSRYSNPTFDAVLDRALATLELPEREALYREATTIAIRDQAIIPLHHQVNLWAARRGFSFEARNDERTMAMSLYLNP
jgi:peptide/nickel transport system substrate-binding protein